MNSASSSSGVIRHGPYPELTWASILVGYFLGVIIAISIGYAALILGFSIEGSELAAILGFGILRGILRRNSIIENNIAQTVASAVNGASSGMMFSVPAIFILGYGSDFNPVLLTFGAIAGAFLGLVGLGAAYYYIEPELPDIDNLKDVQLQVPLKVFSKDGGLIAEFGERVDGNFDVLDYAEHGVGEGADACAVAYVKVRSGETGPLFGVGRHGNIVMASLQAVASAVDRVHLAEAARRESQACEPPTSSTTLARLS